MMWLLAPKPWGSLYCEKELERYRSNQVRTPLMP